MARAFDIGTPRDRSQLQWELTHLQDQPTTRSCKTGVSRIAAYQVFNQADTDFVEMAVDLGKEVGPIANEVIIDFTKQMNEFEQRGYFAFIKEMGPVIDNIVQGFSPKDLKELANSIVSILSIIKEMTQPEVLNTMQNAIKAFNSMETESVPSYSIWKLMRELNSPEMKKALGYGITFMKNVSKDVNIKE